MNLAMNNIGNSSIAKTPKITDKKTSDQLLVGNYCGANEVKLDMTLLKSSNAH